MTSETRKEMAERILEVMDSYKETDSNVLYVTDFEKVGRQLRLLRIKRGISIKEISEAVDISPAFMCKVEHGQMRLTKTVQLMAWVKGLGYDEVRLTL